MIKHNETEPKYILLSQSMVEIKTIVFYAAVKTYSQNNPTERLLSYSRKRQTMNVRKEKESWKRWGDSALVE